MHSKIQFDGPVDFNILTNGDGTFALLVTSDREESSFSLDLEARDLESLRKALG